MNAPPDYRQFLESKMRVAPSFGIGVPLEEINPELKPFTRAIGKGRRGRAVDLHPGYFLDGVKYLEAAERKMATPSMFDFLAAESAGKAEAAE